MQLRSTTIKHKRFSVVGWNDLNPDGTLKNTLSQGEIGVLLGSDLNSVLEIRMGIRDKSAFNEGVLLGTKEISDSQELAIQQFATPASRPSFGSENVLYIVKSNNTAYRWDSDNMAYEAISAPPGAGDGWWHQIFGGTAILEKDVLGTSSPID